MDKLASLREGIIDKNQPIAKRTHAAFLLRTIGTEAAADILCEALCQQDDSSLLRHELGYILGQMQMSKFCGPLSAILENEEEDPLVRHECAEALGAIGEASSLPVLEKFATHVVPEIGETCQIAVDLIRWKEQQRASTADAAPTTATRTPFLSVDPAPPFVTDPPSSSAASATAGTRGEPKSVAELQHILCDAVGHSLFDRYRAMFSLRNLNTDESAVALAAGFSDAGALFKHEIAYVLGQMQRPVTVPQLTAVLRNVNEHKMVRHEAAEALGAVGGPVVEEILRQYSTVEAEPEAVVRESAEVALDTMDYWTAFQASSNSGEGDEAAEQ